MIQVTEPKPCRKQKGFPYDKISYLHATTLEELHAFARRLRLDKKHFRAHPTRPRYNLSPSKRVWAIALVKEGIKPRPQKV